MPTLPKAKKRGPDQV